MNRGKAFLVVAFSSLRDILRALRRQSLSRAYIVSIAIFLLAIVFSVLSISPILSSFIYPLF